MNKINISATTINTVIIMIGVINIALYLFNGLAHYFKIRAVEQCGQVSKVTWVGEDGSQVSEPFKPVYQQCLIDKGY